MYSTHFQMVHVSPLGQWASILHGVSIVTLHRPWRTSALVGSLPFQCSFSIGSGSGTSTAPLRRSGTTLCPFTTYPDGAGVPARSRRVGARSMFVTTWSSVRGAATRRSYRMIIGTRMHSWYGHCFTFQRWDPRE